MRIDALRREGRPRLIQNGVQHIALETVETNNIAVDGTGNMSSVNAAWIDQASPTFLELTSSVLVIRIVFFTQPLMVKV